MTVQEDILTLIKESFPDQAVTASQIAELKQLSRNTVSHHLNRLAEENLLEKIKEKPTKFRIKNAAPKGRSDAFEKIIGALGSMAEVIKQCKASVAYPGGLPLMLNGPSGTGKSFIAEVIYEYAKDQEYIEQSAPFCVLNCADYANNPELLSAVLFGYVKGAFTGADKEKKGLLDEANGGYLFLDEVHNLTPENQEKLFLLIDSGRFRRLGDNEIWVNSNVRLIMATTEKPQSAMLTTFRRRIPYEVSLPKFVERPFNERLELVRNFFYGEANSIQAKISVAPGVIEDLAKKDYPGNVGELKNNVKVLVANELPERGREVVQIAPFAGLMNQRTLLFEPNHLEPVEQLVENKDNGFEQVLVSLTSFEELIAVMPKLLFEIQKESFGGERAEQLDLLAFPAAGFSEFTLECFRGYGFKVGPAELESLKKIMSYCLVQGFRLKKVPLMTNQERVSYRKHYQAAMFFLRKLLVQHPLLVQFTTLLTAFLIKKYPISSQINAVVIMHGKANAQTLAKTVNEMAGDYVFDYFDMPMAVDTTEIVRQIVEYTKWIDTNKGLVILVDMGSLEKIYNAISGNISGDLIVMNNVSTALALEVGLKLTNISTLQQLEQLNLAPFNVQRQYFEGVSQKPNILVACISGEGIAEKIKTILCRYLDDELDVLTLDYNLLKRKSDEMDTLFFKNTVAILTTPKILNDALPIVSIEEIVSNQDALSNLSNYLNPLSMKNCTNDILKLFTIEGAAARLSFLNPERVIDEVGEVITAYETYYSVEFPNFVRINLFLHLSAMIERMLKFGTANGSSDYLPPKSSDFHQFCEFSQVVFQKIVEKYNITIPLSEYGLVYQLVKQSMDS